MASVMQQRLNYDDACSVTMHCFHSNHTYQPYSIILWPPPVRSTAAVFIYGCREVVGKRPDDMDNVGDGVKQASQPLSGETGKTELSGRATTAD